MLALHGSGSAYGALISLRAAGGGSSAAFGVGINVCGALGEVIGLVPVIAAQHAGGACRIALDRIMRDGRINIAGL